MRKSTTLVPAALLASALVYGQNPSRVYPLKQGTDARTLQEIATVLRTVLDVKNLNVDNAGPAISVEGPPSLLASADWLVPLLGARPADTSKPLVYNVPDSGDDVVEVYYLTNINTNIGVQEALTNLRTVTQQQKIFNVTRPGVLVLRGTSAQVAMSEWLLRQLDAAPGNVPAGVHDYAAPTGDVMRVFYLTNPLTREDLQGLVTSVRTKARIMFLFSYSSAPQAIAMRAAPEQIAQAEQIIGAAAR